MTLLICGIIWVNPLTHTVARVCLARELLVHRHISGVAPVARIA